MLSAMNTLDTEWPGDMTAAALSALPEGHGLSGAGCSVCQDRG